MKYILALIIFSLLFSCSENTKIEENKITSETQVDSANLVLETEEPESELIDFDTLELEDFIDSTKFVQEEFKLAKVDTALVNKVYRDLSYMASDLYIYLRLNYNITSTKDSVQYFEGSDEISEECSFYQELDFNISYHTWNCKEEGGGFEETVKFPKISTQEAGSLINELFYDEWNSWKSEFRYEPEGAGCYYEIKQTENNTIISVWCGC